MTGTHYGPPLGETPCGNTEPHRQHGWSRTGRAGHQRFCPGVAEPGTTPDAVFTTVTEFVLEFRRSPNDWVRMGACQPQWMDGSEERCLASLRVPARFEGMSAETEYRITRQVTQATVIQYGKGPLSDPATSLE